MLKINNVNLTIFFVLLTVLFISLKIMGLVGWAWWVVFMPLWVLAGLCAAVVAGAVLYLLLICLTYIVAALIICCVIKRLK